MSAKFTINMIKKLTNYQKNLLIPNYNNDNDIVHYLNNLKDNYPYFIIDLYIATYTKKWPIPLEYSELYLLKNKTLINDLIKNYKLSIYDSNLGTRLVRIFRFQDNLIDDSIYDKYTGKNYVSEIICSSLKNIPKEGCNNLTRKIHSIGEITKVGYS